MELDALRREIDNVDKELIALFTKRMDICAKIGDYKKENGLPVYDKARENRALEGMGTTVAAAVILDDRLIVAHA